MFPFKTLVDCSISYEFSVPPHLKGDGMYDITIKKGRPIRYDLWFGGEPAPSVEWLRDGRTLSADENTSIELYAKNSIYTERNTVLNIPKVMQTFAARIQYYFDGVFGLNVGQPRSVHT